MFLPAKIATTSFPAVDPIGSPLISDLIEFTPELVYSKIMNLHNSKNPRPDGWPIPIIKSVSEFIAIPLSIIFKSHLTLRFYPMAGKIYKWHLFIINVLETKFTTIVQLVSFTSIFSIKTQTTVLYLQYMTETDSIHRIGWDSRWQQSGTTYILINAIHWLHRPCSTPWWFDRVSKKLSVKVDFAIYNHVLG